MLAFSTTDLFWTCLKWLMMLAVWAIWVWGIVQETRQVKNLTRKASKDSEINTILHGFNQRNLQIGIVVSLLMVVTAIKDINDTLTASSLAPLAASNVTAAPNDVSTNSAINDAFRTPTPAAGVPYTDITEFDEKDSKEQAYIDWLKERYESWLVTYYYLQKCGKADPKDFDFIKAALAKDLATAHADATAQGNILLAAEGSYKEMYKDIPCDAARIASTKVSYDANMQQAKEPKAVEQPSEPSSAAQPKVEPKN